mmetsp:Transcript_13965/g.15416  ORF Transcript_13965/g.15416 Transcript_13965/m.15416 type:complete len:234 (+) Transcript_13965:30-731(+)|eukprot:CAMPEP_0114997310 /NCGR_PEP_ID=MMETSP0216-20121206/14822_1 /TAXON_ID=223996 /ORGANISM="Protocruzia adherens, Strain Boccale" /LENGTH=233 /DNA_ID=CAMNT_0002361665 /DNA_START=40 /DNA_END=741 /DNA_ORIENTATION=+
MKSLIAVTIAVLLFLLSQNLSSVPFLSDDASNGFNGVVDISHYQGTNLDFNSAYKQGGIRGVIHKATEGTSWVDSAYETNKSNAKAAGMLWGAYHFATGDDATAQAQHFLSTVRPSFDTLVALDLESGMSLDQAVEWVEYVKAHHGKYPVLYGGSYLKELLGGRANATLSKCPLWLSEYSSFPRLPPGWTYYSLWQYTDSIHGPTPHTTPGLGSTDKDIWNGSEISLKAFWTL